MKNFSKNSVVAMLVFVLIVTAGCAGKNIRTDESSKIKQEEPTIELTREELKQDEHPGVQSSNAPLPLLLEKETVGFIVNNVSIVTTPDWRNRAVSRAIFFGGGEEENPVTSALAFDIDLLLGGGNIYVIFLSAPVGAAHLVYLPIGYTIGKIRGNISEKKWQPCMDAFAEKIKLLAVTEAFQREAKIWTMKHGKAEMINIRAEPAEKQQTCKYLIVMNFSPIKLLECEQKGTFCVELACSAFVYKNENLLQGKNYVYSSSNRINNAEILKKRNEILLSEQSFCRDIEEHCNNPDEIEKMVSSVEKGINALTDAALKDIFEAP